MNAGAKIAPKCLLQVLEASIFNDHQICSFTVAVILFFMLPLLCLRYYFGY